MTKLRPKTLEAKLLFVLLLSVLTGLAVYGAAYALGTLALDRFYMSPGSVAARQAEIYADFAAFVRGGNIDGRDSAAIARYDGGAYTSVTVFRPEDLGLAPGEDAMGSMRARFSSRYGRVYPLRFADGLYYVAIGDSSRTREDGINRLLAVLLGSAAFVSVTLWYMQRLTRRIIRLSREADAIGEGDLEAPITVSGEDELAVLGREMDAMRRSVIDRMSGERRAWEANSQLITAISHDIRTPMTALMGYLELLNEGAGSDPERAKQFASSAYGKATELKELTDELFRYFLVFGRAQLELNLEELDGRLLLEQLLGEAEFDLTEAGFGVQRIEFEGECSVQADPMYLKRVLDNLVSNARKYADPAQPLMILTELRDDRLTVTVSNRVLKSLSRVESTKIGLRTCEKIMESMHGSFTTRRDEEHFAAELSLPAKVREAARDGE